MNRNATTDPIIRSASAAFRPPRFRRVSEGAARSLVIRQPGRPATNWDPKEAPYMVEPMDMLASRVHEALVFVGPARGGKTIGLVDGWFAHNVCHDPGDMLILQMTQEKARDYSKTRIDRAIRHSPDLRARMSLSRQDDNTHDKMTSTGMWVKIGWPSGPQLASSDYRYVAITDHDRMPDDIGGEGAVFMQGLKRVQAMMSRGMCMVESSPGREYKDPHWKPATPHQGPPASGICSIYDRSDRRRWYWQCLDCSHYFEAKPGLSLFSTLPDEVDLMESISSEKNLKAMATHHAFVCCPHCGSQISPEHKHILNDITTARWVADGQTVTTDGEVVGEFEPSSIVGYWLGGVAATYQKWDSIILRYLQGLREYALTGSEMTLKTTTNTDQGLPYLPRHFAEEGGEAVEDRAEDLERYYVPEWTRFLIAAVDVQGGRTARFVVQVHAIGVDMESAVIDRYEITKTARGDSLRIDPAGYAEDWAALTERVVFGTYRVSFGVELRVLHTIVDYGGEAGVSQNAVAWRRSLRQQGLSRRVTLGKGDGKIQDIVRRSHARDARGQKMMDVPLLLFSSDKFKDLIASAMRRTEPGPTYMHFPKWLGAWFYDELRAETRDEKGRWSKIRARNEGLDLWAMIWAAAWNLGPANTARRFDWQNPPAWAAPLERNSEIVSTEDRRAINAQVSTARKPQPIRQPQRRIIR